jgi:transitional endoplasmic reticulum ATPase
MSKFYGESEQKLRKLFEEAEENAPSIIFIDELDAIAPKREDVQGEVERRVVAQLLATMDGLKSRGQVIVIGATNRVNALDPALRRPGRFDREIEIGVPDETGRLEVLHIHSREMPLTTEGEETVDLQKLAKITHGFVGADLQALCREAAMKALRRYLPQLNLADDEIPQDVLDQLEVTNGDFVGALKEIQPSAVREVFIEVPNVKWTDIGGLEDVIQELVEVVEWPLKKPEAFRRLGINPPKGVLIYGPPGCGKTLLARAVATESEANFISVKGPELISKWVGESEKAIREIFRKARTASPSIIFFDEVDAIAPARGGGGSGDFHHSERVISQLLTEMDGLESMKDVVVIAATNRPELIDKALLRTGRFDRFVNVDAPDAKSRKAIFEIYMANMPLDDDVSIKKLVDLTEFYVGGDIEAICREAGMRALRDNMDTEIVSWKHFEAAIKDVHASTTKEMLERFRKLDQILRRSIEVEPGTQSMYG